MSNELKLLAKNILDKKRLASEDAGLNPTTRRVRMGKINRAKEDVKELTEQYRDLLRNRTAFIIVTGSDANKFGDMASKYFHCFSVDADDFYKEITSEVQPRLYKDYNFGKDQLNIIRDTLEEVAKSAGALSIRQIVMQKKYLKKLNTKKDLVNATKGIVNDQVGSEIVGLYAVNKIASDAIEKGFGSKIAPIVLKCEDEGLVEKFKQDFPLMFKNTFVITAGDVNEEISKLALTCIEKSTKKQVEESLSLIRQKLK